MKKETKSSKYHGLADPAFYCNIYTDEKKSNISFKVCVIGEPENEFN
jgi:hypothetical protein